MRASPIGEVFNLARRTTVTAVIPQGTPQFAGGTAPISSPKAPRRTDQATRPADCGAKRRGRVPRADRRLGRWWSVRPGPGPNAVLMPVRRSRARQQSPRCSRDASCPWSSVVEFRGHRPASFYGNRRNLSAAMRGGGLRFTLCSLRLRILLRLSAALTAKLVLVDDLYSRAFRHAGLLRHPHYRRQQG